MQDFANLQLDDISKNISTRRNKIFLLMEEVRRLRIQQRLKVCAAYQAYVSPKAADTSCNTTSM